MFPVIPVALPIPNVAPEANVNAPAPETVLVPVFSVPFTVTVFPVPMVKF